MTAEKKEKSLASSIKPEKTECNPHHFVVTGWFNKGGHQNATLMRCCQCLKPANLEEQESKEFKEKQGF